MRYVKGSVHINKAGSKETRLLSKHARRYEEQSCIIQKPVDTYRFPARRG